MRRSSAPLVVASRQRGIALVFVLWGGLLISAIALGLSLTAGAQLATSSGASDRLRVEAVADAGIRAGIVKLLDRTSAATLLPRRFEFELAGATAEVSIVSEHGRVDLNAAPEPMVRALADLVTDGNGHVLAEAWLARRAGETPIDALDADTDADSEQAPVTGAFMVTRELLDLPGVSGAAFERLQAATTVYSRHPGIDPLNAPRDVLLALPGASPEVVDEFIAERDELAGETQRQDLAGLIGRLRARLTVAAGLLSNRRPVVFTVTSVARLSNGAQAVRQAVVSLRRTPTQPYTILQWSDRDWAARDAVSLPVEAAPS